MSGDHQDMIEEDSFPVSETSDSGVECSEASENSEGKCRIDEMVRQRKLSIDTTSTEVPFGQNKLRKNSVHARTVASEFSVSALKKLKEAFIKYDKDKDNYIGFEDLKYMMEKLGIPQTHLALKALIKEVDEDFDNRINFNEFLMIFKKARAGELGCIGDQDGLLAWFEMYIGVNEIDVDDVGVKEAKNFFESKIVLSTMGNKYERELKEEQMRRQLEEEAKRARAQEFKEKRAMFS